MFRRRSIGFTFRSVIFGLITSVFTESLVSAADASCVWKNGNSAVSTTSKSAPRPLVACDPDAAYSGTGSSCCIQGDSCLASGMCYGAAGMPYRGACTDPTKYGTPACPDNCIDIIPDGVANMYGCTAGVENNGGILTFWCGLGTPCDDSSDNNGETTASGWFPNGVTIKSANTSKSSPSPMSTASSSSTTTLPPVVAAPDTCNACHEAAVGGGIGSCLGAVILVLFVLLIFERRRRYRSPLKPLEYAEENGKHVISASAKTDGWYKGGPSQPELPDSRSRAELAGCSGPKHEAS